MDIVSALRRCNVTDVDWETNLEDGICRMKEARDEGRPYDFVITGMHFPLKASEEPVWDAGEIAIEQIRNLQSNAKIVVCSSMNMRLPEADGCLWYASQSDWEMELMIMLRNMK